jgi:ABC-type nitrate/sulfonate/bicarbonate transport system substrate-binding protein
MHGFPIKAIVAGERYSSYQVLARPEISTPADLKGGKGGVSRINSGDYYILVDWLRRQGLDGDNDVTMINIGGTDARFNSLISGAIDVALLAAPASLLAIKEGARVLGNPDSLIAYPLGGLATTEKKLSEQRGEVRRVLRAYLQALQLMQRDEDATVAALRAYLDVDDEVARGSYRFVRDTMSPDGTTPEAGIRLILDVERAAIGSTEDFPITTGVDFSVLREVQQELSGAAPATRTP